MKYLILLLIFSSTVAFSQNCEILWSREIEPVEQGEPNFNYIPYTLNYNLANNQVVILGTKYENKKLDNNKLFLLSIDFKTKECVMQTVVDKPFQKRRPFWQSRGMVKGVYTKQGYLNVQIEDKDAGINEFKIGKNKQVEERKLLSKDKKTNVVQENAGYRISKICNTDSSFFMAGINSQTKNALLEKRNIENEVVWREEYDTGCTEHFTDVKYCSFIDCLYVVGGLINQTGNDQYTSENQHIWLLSIDPSDGKTIIDTVLPGYSVLGKEPAICCSESGGVIVVSDRAGNLKNANVVVTAFPPSLEKELWERTLYTSTSMSSCFEIVPMDDKGYCVSFLSNSRDLYIYKLNSNGKVKGSFVREKAVVGGNYAICESDNKVFLVYQNESKTRKSSGLQLMQLEFKEN